MNAASTSEVPSIIGNERHMVSVIKFATGNDDQSHVSTPPTKQQASMARQRKDHIKSLLNRNKSELETI